MEDEVLEENVEVSDQVENQEIDTVIEDSDNEWIPDFSYDVKGEKKEFDEWIRGSVNSKDEEERLRELYTKADGLDAIKQKANEYETNYNSASEQIELMAKGFNTLKDIRDTNDIDKLVEALGVSGSEDFQDAILEWAIKKVDFMSLPQEEQEKITNVNSQAKELDSLRSQVQTLQSQSTTSRHEGEMSKLRGIISSNWGDLNDKLTSVGVNFEDEVLMNGTNHFRMTNTEPTIEEAIAMTAKKYGFINTQTQASGQQQVPIETVLPRVRSGKNSSVSDSIRSIDDLKKLAARMGA